MTDKTNSIDVSECSCKDDDKCFEAPILNEYGDLIDYQDCESQTLCPYRSKIKIQRLQKENEELKKRQITKNGFICDCEQNAKYKQALEEIRSYCDEQNLKADYTACYITNKIDEVFGQ